MLKYIIRSVSPLILTLFMFTSYAEAADCSDTTIQSEVNFIVKRMGQAEPGRDLQAFVDEKMPGASLEEKQEAARAIIEMGVRNGKNCPIPDELLDRISSYIDEEKGTLKCSDTRFLPEAEAEYRALVNAGELEQIEQLVYAQLSQSFKGEEKARFDSKWQDKDVRKLFILALYRMNKREEAGCKDQTQPLQELIVEYIKK